MTQAREALASKLDVLRAERDAVEARLALNGLRGDPRLDRQRLRRVTRELAVLEGDLAELDQFSLVGDGHPRYDDAA